MAEREELIELMNEAESRGDMETAKQALLRLESMPKTARERVADWKKGIQRGLGRTGRMTADAVAAFPLAAMDAGIGVRNLYSELSNLNRPPLSTDPLKRTYESASSMYKRGMDQTPLPPPEGTAENVVDVLGQIAVGAKVMPNVSIKNPIPQKIPLKSLGEKALKAGEQFNVPVHYDDVGGNLAKRVNVAAERVPFTGTGAGKAAQQQAVNKATQKLVDAHYIDDIDDIPNLVQKGLQTKLGNARKAAGQLYDEVARLTDPHGPVPTNRFDDVLMREMAEQEAMGTAADPGVMEILERFASAPRGNFTLMRQLRTQLRNELDKFYTGGSAVGKSGVGPVQAAKEALEQDMADFAENVSPQSRTAWRKANNFYKNMIVPFKTTGLRQLVNTDEPAKAWRYLTQQSAGPDRAKKMYMALDSKGRAAVRNGLLDDAVEFAKTPQGNVSPAKLAQYMEKHSNAINQFFGGRYLKELEGFRNLMRHVERAGQYMENPPTGQRAIDFAVGGGAVAAALSPTMLKLVAAIETSGAAVTAAFQTKAGRDALFAMSKYKPGSNEMENAAKVLAKVMSATVATQSTGE